MGKIKKISFSFFKVSKCDSENVYIIKEINSLITLILSAEEESYEADVVEM